MKIVEKGLIIPRKRKLQLVKADVWHLDKNGKLLWEAKGITNI